MTIQDLGALGEFLSSIVVLVTLGYLAFQTRQTNMAIGAQLDAARVSSAQNIMLTPVTSSELADAVIEDQSHPLSVNDLRRTYYWNALFFTWQWQFVQGRQGLLKSFSEPGLGYIVGLSFASSQGMGAWWENAKSSWLPEFVAWVEEQRAKAA